MSRQVSRPTVTDQPGWWTRKSPTVSVSTEPVQRAGALIVGKAEVCPGPSEYRSIFLHTGCGAHVQTPGCRLIRRRRIGIPAAHYVKELSDLPVARERDLAWR